MNLKVLLGAVASVKEKGDILGEVSPNVTLGGNLHRRMVAFVPVAGRFASVQKENEVSAFRRSPRSL